MGSTVTLPGDQLKAKGLIANIREVVNQQDALTRMNNAREEERKARLAEAQRAAAEKRQRASRIEAAKFELHALLGAAISAQERGKKLAMVLNNLFQAYDVLVRKAFHLTAEVGEGIVEQIDGVIELGGVLYFVAMKGCHSTVSKPAISKHLVRLMSRAEIRGNFISDSDYTEPAIHTVRKSLQYKVEILSMLQEIVRLLGHQDNIAEFFMDNGQAAQIQKNPFFQTDGVQARGAS